AGSGRRSAPRIPDQPSPARRRSALSPARFPPTPARDKRRYARDPGTAASPRKRRRLPWPPGRRPCSERGMPERRTTLLRSSASRDRPDRLDAILPDRIQLIVLVHHGIAVGHDELELIADRVRSLGGLVPDHAELVGSGVVGEVALADHP